MQKKTICHSAFLDLRSLITLAVLVGGLALALFVKANPRPLVHEPLRRSQGPPFTPAGTPQEAWVATYDGPGNVVDEAKAIAVDSSGNVYVTGRSGGGPSTDFDYATAKYNSAGQEQWVARYNGPENLADEAKAIAVDNSGNVYVTGTSGTAYATIKYNSDGQQQWVMRYNPDNIFSEASAITLDSSGNVYVTGFASTSASAEDYATIKYNTGGQEQWVARYSGPGATSADYAAAIAVDSSGNVYVTGDSEGDYTTVKYNSAGQQQWAARYDDPVHQVDGAFAVAVDDLGYVYVTGSSFGSGGSYDYATIKYNASGQEEWTARYDGPANGQDFAAAIALDNSGNVYVTGSSEGSDTSDDYATIKYDTTGQQQWVARYNGPGNALDVAYSIVLDHSGGVYVTGYSEGDGTADDYATIKYNSGGEEEWIARYNGADNMFDDAEAIAIDSFGNVYVTGESSTDYATIKYAQGGTPTPTPTATATSTPTPTATPRATPRPRPTPHPRPTLR